MGFWASFGSAASSALGSAVGGSFGSIGDLVTGGYFTRKGQSQQNRYNLYSTGTAHQREVNDLRMAGLNPVLSAIGNGAAVLPVQGSTASPTDFSGVAQRAVEHGLQAYNARTQRNLAEQQIRLNQEQLGLTGQQQETERTQQGLNNALANKAATDSALNSAKAQGEQIRNAIELMKSKYLRNASPQLRDFVINSMLTGSGSSLFGSIMQNGMSAGEPITVGLNRFGQFLFNFFKSSDSNATQSHSSAKQMKRNVDGYEDRKKWLENLREESKYADGYEERKKWLEELRKELK